MPWQIVSDPDTKCYTNFNAILWATSAFTWTVNCLYCIMLSLSQYLLFTVHCSRCFAFVLRKSLKSVLVYNNPILDSRISFISNIWMQKDPPPQPPNQTLVPWSTNVTRSKKLLRLSVNGSYRYAQGSRSIFSFMNKSRTLKNPLYDACDAPLQCHTSVYCLHIALRVGSNLAKSSQVYLWRPIV